MVSLSLLRRREPVHELEILHISTCETVKSLPTRSLATLLELTDPPFAFFSFPQRRRDSFGHRHSKFETYTAERVGESRRRAAELCRYQEVRPPSSSSLRFAKPRATRRPNSRFAFSPLPPFQCNQGPHRFLDGYLVSLGSFERVRRLRGSYTWVSLAILF